MVKVPLMILSSALILQNCKTVKQPNSHSSTALDMNTPGSRQPTEPVLYKAYDTQNAFRDLDPSEEYIILDRFTPGLGAPEAGLGLNSVKFANLANAIDKKNLSSVHMTNNILGKAVFFGDIYDRFRTRPGKRLLKEKNFMGMGDLNFFEEKDKGKIRSIIENFDLRFKELDKKLEDQIKDLRSKFTFSLHAENDLRSKHEEYILVNQQNLEKRLRAHLKDEYGNSKFDQYFAYEETSAPYRFYALNADLLGIVPKVMGKTVDLAYTAAVDLGLVAAYFNRAGENLIAPTSGPVLLARLVYDTNFAKWAYRGREWIMGTSVPKILGDFETHLDTLITAKDPKFLDFATSQKVKLNAVATLTDDIVALEKKLAAAKDDIKARVDLRKELSQMKKKANTEVDALIDTIYNNPDFLSYRIKTSTNRLDRMVLLTKQQYQKFRGPKTEIDAKGVEVKASAQSAPTPAPVTP